MAALQVPASFVHNLAGLLDDLALDARTTEAVSTARDAVSLMVELMDEGDRVEVCPGARKVAGLSHALTGLLSPVPRAMVAFGMGCPPSPWTDERIVYRGTRASALILPDILVAQLAGVLADLVAGDPGVVVRERAASVADVLWKVVEALDADEPDMTVLDERLRRLLGPRTFSMATLGGD